MGRKEAIHVLEMIRKECIGQYDDGYEALTMAIEDMEEKERTRRAWEELIAEERT